MGLVAAHVAHPESEGVISKRLSLSWQNAMEVCVIHFLREPSANEQGRAATAWLRVPVILINRDTCTTHQGSYLACDCWWAQAASGHPWPGHCSQYCGRGPGCLLGCLHPQFTRLLAFVFFPSYFFLSFLTFLLCCFTDTEPQDRLHSTKALCLGFSLPIRQPQKPCMLLCYWTTGESHCFSRSSGLLSPLHKENHLFP